MAEMHQGRNLSKLEEVLQKCAFTDELFAFIDPVGANKFYSMWEWSRDLLDLFCIPLSTSPEGSVFCFSGVIQIS